MTCAGVCKKYKKIRNYNTPDSKFCRACNIFMRWSKNECPCCQNKLKSKPRNSKRLKSFWDNNPDRAPKRH